MNWPLTGRYLEAKRIAMSAAELAGNARARFIAEAIGADE